MINAGLDEAQAGIKIARRNINNLRYADDTTLMAESEEELKSLLTKEESEKVGLKLNKDHGIWSHHFTANRWENSGNSVRLGMDLQRAELKVYKKGAERWDVTVDVFFFSVNRVSTSRKVHSGAFFFFLSKAPAWS